MCRISKGNTAKYLLGLGLWAHNLRMKQDQRSCPVPLTVRGTQTLVSFAPLAFKLFYAARHGLRTVFNYAWRVVCV